MTALRAKEEWAIGWPLIISCVVGMSTPTVGYWTLGQFIVPLERAFGWSRTQTTMGLSISLLVPVLLYPLVGHATDVMNSRKLALAGVILTGCALGALSFANGNLTLWVALWLLHFLCGAMALTVVWISVIPGVFKVHRSLATAVALTGTSLAGVLAPMLASYLIELYGWRNAYRLLPLIWHGVTLLLVFCFFFDRRPRGTKATPEVRRTRGEQASLRALFLTPIFLKLACVVFAVTTTTAAYIVHLSPSLLDRGFLPLEAAKLAGVAGIATVLGKLSVGWVFDRLSFPIVAVGIMTMLAAASLLFVTLHGQTLWAIAACLALGATIGAMLTLNACVTRQIFPADAFGVLFGGLASLMALATAIGTTLAGFVHDQTGSYNGVYWAGLAAAVLSALVLMTLRPVSTQVGVLSKIGSP
jgi:predicted MFS family arabinose efflux permease